jgi:hypothetical protein
VLISLRSQEIAAYLVIMCLICRKKIEEYGRDDRQEVVSKTIDGCAPLFLACRFTTRYFFSSKFTIFGE